MADTVLLLSIRPGHAKKIFAGEKTVELRRVRPRIAEGDQILIYVSSPVKALAGVCRVHQLLEGAPEQLWPRVRDHAGMTRQEFNTYYAGAEMGFAIVLQTVGRYSNPVTLDTLREQWPGFHPPQGYQYVSYERAKAVSRLPSD